MKDIDRMKTVTFYDLTESVINFFFNKNKKQHNSKKATAPSTIKKLSK